MNQIHDIIIIELTKSLCKMALFGHDDNVRRLSTPHSSQKGDNSSDGDSVKQARCTVAKAKSCMKMFIANLFSHVGLCALVIGYSIMGAFVFKKLEKDNEMNTRIGVGRDRENILEQLYNITGRFSIYHF